jgi:hypothetical protein
MWKINNACTDMVVFNSGGDYGGVDDFCSDK